MQSRDLNKKVKNIEGIMMVLRVLHYEDHPIYIRKVRDDIFMYDLIHNNQIYSSYMVFSPRKDRKKLSRSEIDKAASLIYAGAVATIDLLIGKKTNGENKKVAKQVIDTVGI